MAAALVVRPEIEVRSGGSVLRIGWSGGGAGAPGPARAGRRRESGGAPSGSGGALAETDGAAAESGRVPPGPSPRPTAMEPAAGPTLRGTPAGLRTGGGAVPIPGPGLGAGRRPDGG